jgi:hypothetical protein
MNFIRPRGESIEKRNVGYKKWRQWVFWLEKIGIKRKKWCERLSETGASWNLRNEGCMKKGKGNGNGFIEWLHRLYVRNGRKSGISVSLVGTCWRPTDDGRTRSLSASKKTAWWSAWKFDGDTGEICQPLSVLRCLGLTGPKSLSSRMEMRWVTLRYRKTGPIFETRVNVFYQRTVVIHYFVHELSTENKSLTRFGRCNYLRFANIARTAKMNSLWRRSVNKLDSLSIVKSCTEPPTPPAIQTIRPFKG